MASLGLPLRKSNLKKLAEQNTPAREIDLKLGRTEDGIRSKARDLDLSLKSTNLSPYGTGK